MLRKLCSPIITIKHSKGHHTTNPKKFVKSKDSLHMDNPTTFKLHPFRSLGVRSYENKIIVTAAWKHSYIALQLWDKTMHSYKSHPGAWILMLALFSCHTGAIGWKSILLVPQGLIDYIVFYAVSAIFWPKNWTDEVMKKVIPF